MLTRKEEIRQCAAKLFRRKGYKATSMRDIAEEVGIKAASIYNHIESKQELLRDLLLNIANLFTTEMQSISGSSLDTEEKLNRLITLHIKLTAEHTNAISLIAGEWVHLDEPEKKQYISLRDEYEASFREIIEDGKKEGVFKEVDTDIALFSILSTLRWLYSWYSKNSNYNLIDLEKQINLCLITGLKA